MKNNVFWRAMAAAWSLAFDAALPRSWRPDEEQTGKAAAGTAPVPPEFIVCALPLWGAVWAFAAWLLSRLLEGTAPETGGAVLFALILTVASEWRTSSRGLALTASVGEALLSGEKWRAAMEGRQATVRKLTGPYANLLVMALLAAKFFALFQCYASKHPGFAGAALVAALTVEAVMAVQPPCDGGAPMIAGGSAPYAVVWVGGFLLLFSFIYLPLPTLLTAGTAGFLCWIFTNERQCAAGRLVSDDMTLAGYATEWLALFFALLLVR